MLSSCNTICLFELIDKNDEKISKEISGIYIEEKDSLNSSVIKIKGDKCEILWKIPDEKSVLTHYKIKFRRIGTSKIVQLYEDTNNKVHAINRILCVLIFKYEIIGENYDIYEINKEYLENLDLEKSILFKVVQERVVIFEDKESFSMFIRKNETKPSFWKKLTTFKKI